jgi:nucleoside 2-deoxyribosyltransferase
MKAFIAYSLERVHLKELEERLDQITAGAAQAGYLAYAHVRDGQNWVLGGTSIQEMMTLVFGEIRSSDVVLLDLTSNSKSKRTGLNIELGYALAHSKPIVALYRSGDRPNMTTDLADYEISYDSVSQISFSVAATLRKLQDESDTLSSRL